MNFEDYRQKYFEGLERGLPRLNGIRNALDEALQTQDVEGALQLYYEYMDEDVIHNDGYKAVLLFPEYVSFFEQHPEMHEDYNRDMMWSYKWVLNGIADFPQISLEKIESLYNQYADFCKRFNYGLRSYYNSLWRFIFEYVGKDKKFCGVDTREAHKKMLLEKRDDITDCLACEASDESYYYDKVENDLEKALSIAGPVLSGKLHCVEQPHCTLANIAESYLERGDLEKADMYATRSERLILRDFGNESNLLIKKSICMLVLSFIKPMEAIRLFRKTLAYAAASSNPNVAFEVYRASYILMKNLDDHKVEEIKVRLPFSDDPLYNENNLYKPAVLKDFFYAKAKDIADKFDKRDGNTLFLERLNYQFKPDYEKYVPYEGAPDCPYLEYIQYNMEDGLLPDYFALPNPEKDSDGERLEDGTADAITLFGTGIEHAEIGEFENLIRFAVNKSDVAAAAKTDRYFENNNVRALSLVDNLQQYIIENQETLPPEKIYGFGVELAVSGRHKESVKAGLCILELFSGYNDALLNAIMDLAQCNEFTLFCVWAVRKLENGNDLIFEIAQKTHGWGRIIALNYLQPETDEIREWILTEGLKNDIYPGYSVLDVFRKADVHSLLENGLTQEQLSPVGADLAYMIIDGPTQGIKAFEDELDIVNMYLDSAENLELHDIDYNILRTIGMNYDNEEVKERIRNMGIEFEEEESEE